MNSASLRPFYFLIKKNLRYDLRRYRLACRF
jgi:hypothetical protein